MRLHGQMLQQPIPASGWNQSQAARIQKASSCIRSRFSWQHGPTPTRQWEMSVYAVRSIPHSSVPLWFCLPALLHIILPHFSISLVHDGELSRAVYSRAWSQPVTQVECLAVHFTPVNSCSHTHTHTLSQGRWSHSSRRNLAANQNMIPCPCSTWVACS